MYYGEAHEQVVGQNLDGTVPHFEISNLLEILQRVHFLTTLIYEKKEKSNGRSLFNPILQILMAHCRSFDNFVKPIF